MRGPWGKGAFTGGGRPGGGDSISMGSEKHRTLRFGSDHNTGSSFVDLEMSDGNLELLINNFISSEVKRMQK